MLSEGDPKTPGQFVDDLLRERGWSRRVLAVVLGKDETIISKIISGTRAVDGETALAFGEVFGVPAEAFLALQQSYDLARARIVARPDPGRLTRAHIFGGLPLTDMIARGWIKAQDVRDVKAIESELLRFFGVAGLSDIEIMPHAAKKTEVSMPVNPAQLAWLYRTKRIAAEVLVPRYSPAALRSAIPRLHELMNSPENARHVPRMLMECGVRFVVVETIGNAKMDGVCFWLKDGTSPVVGMTLRFDRIDNFWFVLRHELEHVLLEHGRSAMMVDAELDGERGGTGASLPEEERLANEAAANFCVPQDKLRKFVAVKAPFFPERDMIGFARTLKVHPGIVAGQVRRATGRYELYAKHTAKIRFAVAPTATVDGWGDVVPLT